MRTASAMSPRWVVIMKVAPVMGLRRRQVFRLRLPKFKVSGRERKAAVMKLMITLSMGETA